MLLKREDQLDLEEEAMELEPLFSRGEAIAQRYGEGKWGQALACPRPTRVTVSGFSRYSNSLASLPASEQIRVKNVARLIIRSFRPGCQPIVAVRLVGHADYDPLRERREPGVMLRISRARALAVRQALETLINNRAIATRIAWDVRGVGASRLVPTVNGWRGRNRRVEIWLSGKMSVREFDTLREGGGGAGGAGSGASVIEPFPTTAPALALADNGSLGINSSLNIIMSRLAADPVTKNMCIAVVDLLTPPRGADGLYQGFNDDDMLYVGSLQKISAMYAAFELRSRVQQHVTLARAGGPPPSAADWRKMQLDLKRAWQPKLNKAFPPPLPSGFPDLNTIFSLSAAGKVDFSTSGTSKAGLDRIGSLAGLKFLEWLKLMLRWSDDKAASKCILALSYPYINGVLQGAGLFKPYSTGITGLSPSPPRGLWISGNYADITKNWIRDNTADDANAGQPKTAPSRADGARTPWATPARPKTNFAATARTVAQLFALIAKNRLVDATSSEEMRGFLSTAELNRNPINQGGRGSYIESALHNAGSTFDKVFSKNGIGDDHFYHDAGIVQWAAATGRPPRYVAVVLGCKNDNMASLLKAFALINTYILL